MAENHAELDPNFRRAMFALEHQFDNVNDMIKFWKLLGPSRLGPWPERLDPWFQNLPSVINML